jgi:hypothetical protein
VHDRAGRVRAGDRALEVDRQQRVELAFPLPRRRLAGEHVGASVVDPHVEAAELLARRGDEPLAGLAGPQVGLADVRAAAAGRDRLGDLARALGRAAVRDQYHGSLSGEGLGDGAADPAARPGHNGVQAGEPACPGGWLRLAGQSSTPPANGWRAASAESATVLTLGSPFSARSIDSLVAW